jgi:hypothetical protein
VLFSFVEFIGKWNAQKIYDPPEMDAEFYVTPHFQVHKKV